MKYYHSFYDWNGGIHEGKEVSFDESHDVFIEPGPWYLLRTVFVVDEKFLAHSKFRLMFLPD